ncbi:SLAM family member 5-like [Acipenser oxyrinchus oxyrinchus]|uniref:SLAM family member 5-like n=1 Tax=Acipenser oxyrinchus oxyrinchus TaxID=40147 RepID=A0AAD8FNV9_ACIOX|nr:SLAM family member 5-like [Acipenser oxyrinchus oxyrinchus]
MERPCLSADQLVIQRVNGIVGESLTFPVEIPNLQPDIEVYWRYGLVDPDSPIVKIQNGKIKVFEERFKARLQLDNMSSSLRINGLEREDSGIYQVEEIGGNKFKKRFQLSVYNPVPAPHVQKINGSESLGNRSCTLLCFVGNASEVNVSWMRDGKPLHTTELYPWQETESDFVVFTCVASNPASNKSITVTPSDYCGKRNGNKDDAQKSHILIPVIVLAVIGVLAVLSITLYLRRKKTAFEKEGSERSRNSSGIVYAEVTAAPPAGSGEDIPELAAARQTTAKLTTIYDELRTPSSQNTPC